MKNKLKSLNLLFKLSNNYSLKREKIEKNFNIYFDFICNSKNFKINSFHYINKLLFLFYLIYLISPVHFLLINAQYLYINKFKEKKIVLNINKSLVDRWRSFSNNESVHTIVVNSFWGKFLNKRLAYKYAFYIISNYVLLVLKNIFDTKNRFLYFYDLELYQKFINDYTLGNFLGGFDIKTSLDASAYTLTFLKYIGIKETNQLIDVNAVQVHSASKEPMMILFQADKILSINKNTSLHYSQMFGKRKEVVVGSRLLEKYIKKFSEPLIYNPKKNSLLLLFGNTHNPNGLYYGKHHNSLYKRFLKDLKKLSIEFPSWQFNYLHHHNFTSDFETNYFSTSCFYSLDKFSNVYSNALNYSLVISFGSTVVTELYDYHPNIFMYSPTSKSPYRVIDNKFRFITNYKNLRNLLKNTKHSISRNKIKIYMPNNNEYDFDQKVLKACL